MRQHGNPRICDTKFKVMKPGGLNCCFSSIIVCGRVGAVEKRTGLKQCGFIIDEYRKEKENCRGECVVFGGHNIFTI